MFCLLCPVVDDQLMVGNEPIVGNQLIVICFRIWSPFVLSLVWLQWSLGEALHRRTRSYWTSAPDRRLWELRPHRRPGLSRRGLVWREVWASDRWPPGPVSCRTGRAAIRWGTVGIVTTIAWVWSWWSQVLVLGHGLTDWWKCCRYWIIHLQYSSPEIPII